MGPDRNSIKYEIASDMIDPKTELVSPLMKLRLGHASVSTLLRALACLFSPTLSIKI